MRPHVPKRGGKLGFLDHEFNVQGTPFSQEDLDYARGYWRFLIKAVEPTWLENPKGRLAIDWLSDTVPSAVYLIDLARMLYSLTHSMTKESNQVFGSKLHALLLSEGVQYEEQTTELLVGGLLTKLGKPIKMEPPSMTGSAQGASRRSVDYGIPWDDESGEIFVESTVFHVGRLVEWESAIADLKTRFEKAIIQANANCALQITAPLALTHKTVSVHQLRAAIETMAKISKGRRLIAIGEEHLVLEWEPVPHFDSVFDSGLRPPIGFASTVGHGVQVATIAATSVALKWPGKAEELVNKSLRNTLNKKLDQFDLPSPYLLLVRPLSEHIPLSGLVDLLTRRVFPNDNYRRISALGLINVRFAQNTAIRSKVKLILNPRANHPLPSSLVAALV